MPIPALSKYIIFIHSLENQPKMIPFLTILYGFSGKKGFFSKIEINRSLYEEYCFL